MAERPRLSKNAGGDRRNIVSRWRYGETLQILVRDSRLQSKGGRVAEAHFLR